MPESVKACVLGGGSPFVLTLLYGLTRAAERWQSVDLLLSLYDVVPERAERWKAYGEVLRRRVGLSLRVEIAPTRDEAMRDARLTLVSIGAPDAHELAHKMRKKYGFPFHSIHDGPPGFAAAKRLFPLCREIGEAQNRLCPKGFLLLLPNPTDALANAVARATGAHVAGFCVEVEHLRDHLAYYTGISRDRFQLDHAGVNHDGWVLRLWLDGEDGYPFLHDLLLELPQREDFHPGNWGLVQIYRATGYLRSSAYHNWPIPVGTFSGSAPWSGFDRAEVLRLVDEAIRTETLLDNRESLHPEHRPVKYAGTGIALERILFGQATRQPQIVPLQVRNDGAISNLPDDVQVEVPTVVWGEAHFARAMGPLPEFLAGTTRLLALQRKYEADWLLDSRLETLRRALFCLPTIAPVETLDAYAKELHTL